MADTGKNQTFTGSIPKTRSKFIRYALLAVVIIISISLLISAAGYYFYKKSKAPPKDVSAALHDIGVKQNSSNTKQSNKQIKDIINKDITPKEKANAYAQLGFNYANTGNTAQALENFKAAEAIMGDKTTTAIYGQMASIFEINHDKKNAIVYFQKAIAAAKTSPDPSDTMYINTYQDHINKINNSP